MSKLAELIMGSVPKKFMVAIAAEDAVAGARNSIGDIQQALKKIARAVAESEATLKRLIPEFARKLAWQVLGRVSELEVNQTRRQMDRASCVVKELRFAIPVLEEMVETEQANLDRAKRVVDLFERFVEAKRRAAKEHDSGTQDFQKAVWFLEANCREFGSEGEMDYAKFLKDLKKYRPKDFWFPHRPGSQTPGVE